jgi:hypothetical protein
MDLCLFRIRLSADSGHIAVRILPAEEDARSIFASDGDKFIAPVAHLSVRHTGGSVTVGSPPAFQPPIASTETLPALGDENHVWRGYGNNARGVLKMRGGPLNRAFC